MFLALRGTGIGASPHVGRLSACLPTPEPRPLPPVNTAVHPAGKLSLLYRKTNSILPKYTATEDQDSSIREFAELET